MKWLERSGYGYATSYPKGTLPLDQLRITFDHQMYYCTLRYKIPESTNDQLPILDEVQNTGVIYACYVDDPSNGRLLAITRVDGNFGAL